MTVNLPKGWGPATTLVVLYALLVVIGGVIEIAQGDTSLVDYLNTDAVKWLAGTTGLLAVGRGVTAIGSPESVLKGKGEVNK